MLDDVAAYFAEVEKIDKEYADEVEALRKILVANKRGAARTEGDEKLGVITRTMGRVCSARKEEARARLVLSGDKVVSWMVRNCSSQPNHVDIMLKELPLDLAGMRAVCSRHGWCSDFDRYLDAAVRAGIVSDGRSPEVRELDEWLRNTIGVREPYMVQFNEKLNKLLAAYKGNAPEPVAA